MTVLLGNEILKLRTIRSPWLLLAVTQAIIVAGISAMMTGADPSQATTTSMAQGTPAGMVSLVTLVLGITAVAGPDHRRGVAQHSRRSRLERRLRSHWRRRRRPGPQPGRGDHAALLWIALVEGIVSQLLGSLGRWLPFAAGQALDNMAPSTTAPPQWAAALALLAYAVVFATLAMSTTVRRDVT